MRAFLNLRYTENTRAKIFQKGLDALGYQVFKGCSAKPEIGDVFVTWNRIHQGHNTASLFEQAGCKVIVAENASWGNSFAGFDWYHLALNYHNQSGRFPIGDNSRWDSLNVELKPFRTEGETVILPQRGIGPPGIAMPRTWGGNFQGRIRRHPGKKDTNPIEKDLKNCGKVITWGSGAAIKALMMGIPVESHMPRWIGQQDNTNQGRIEMFRRLAWAQWRLAEIESGEAFSWLLN